jgi:pimeloyl-ACP methyl ester carboxylesterase
MASATETLEVRIHDAGVEPVIVYLPGLHGDWTLLAGFRRALAGRACLVEFSYPRRSDCSPDDYVREILAALRNRGLKRAWLLGESFGSLVAWSFIARSARDPSRRNAAPAPEFEVQGLILAGGFVWHPLMWGVALVHQVSRVIPMWMLSAACRAWAHWAERRCAGCTEAVEGIREFVARRTNSEDRAAINARYRMILESDPRAVAQSAHFPVLSITGTIDPIVPWPIVSRWLRRNCPGYGETRVIRRAGHAVLLDAPIESANQVLRWMAASPPKDHVQTGKA